MAAKERSSTETTYRLAAVIDVGSTSIRMVVAQIFSDGHFEALDSLSQSVAVGSDTFTRGQISRSTTEECVKVLRSFSAVLAEYKIDPDKAVRAVATSAVREARNRDEFLDRLYMASGINVKVIEGAEVSRLTFLGIQPLLAAHKELRDGRLIGVEVGGGSTELLGLEDGRVSFAHTYRLGAYRLSEAMAARPGSAARRRELLEIEVTAGVRQCSETADAASGKAALLLMGGEARLAATLILKEWDERSLVQLKISDLKKLSARVFQMDAEQLVQKYHLALEEAQTFGPALVVYIRLAEAFSRKRVFVCGVTLRDGLLAEAASGNAWTDDFVEQLLSSVHETGRKYHFDEAHAECVTDCALAVFRAMQKEHQLGVRHEVILKVAGLLHDVGMFISASAHHKHSRYLIENSEIFGLGRKSLQMAALVARYHRRAMPQFRHTDYAVLPREERLAVSKLSAILRVADALDRSHTQGLKDIAVRLRPGQVVMQSAGPGEFSAEKRALVGKGKLFEQVFGRTVVLRTLRRRGMTDMTAKKEPQFFNRELSWLAFNQRVLEQAKDPALPMLERLKFLAITASNLDEFFMVRVGGLQMARKAGLRRKDPSGMTPLMQLKKIYRQAAGMMTDLHRSFNEVVAPALEAAGIRRVPLDGLSSEQNSALYDLFAEELFPVLTPMRVSDSEPFPLLQNLSIHLLVRLRKAGEIEAGYAVIPLDRAGGRIIQLPAGSGFEYVLREEAVLKHAPDWFPGYELCECALFRMTRNADFAVQEEEAPDLLTGMEDVLEERKTGECIRLEVDDGISRGMLDFLCGCLSVEPQQVTALSGPLNLKDFMSMAFMEGYDELKTEAWPPQPSPDVVPNEPMFDQIARGDLLFYHPYESFDPVVRFIEEAAADPDTMAIKMVLYRTSSDSAIVHALKRAAGTGINVTVLMELKARFDEARNIGWARDLEQCGVQVIYGVKGYKTHAKICLVVRREPTGIMRYCHFGTGNYNESTAKLYGDVSYLTCNAELSADGSAFFNALCGYAQPQLFNLISMAPVFMRDKLLELIDFETARAEKGKKAFVKAKVNSLVDPLLIERLLAAAAAGVKVQLNVRGICCLKPQRHLEVISIVDRYLEHARIIHFCHGGNPQVFIASADWMPRNLDKRLELMVPVEDAVCRDRLIRILEVHMADTCSSWALQEDGSYEKVSAKGGAVRSQQVFYEQACEAAAESARRRRTRFKPHRPEHES